MLAPRSDETLPLDYFFKNNDRIQHNIWISDRDGKYQLLLPPGTYQISIRRSGFKRLKTSSFNLLNPQFITFDFELEPRTGFRGLLEDLLEKITF